MPDSRIGRSAAVTAFFSAAAMFSISAFADQKPSDDPVHAFDHAMLSIFHRGQDALTAQTRPVMIIARDVTVMTRNGEATYPRDAPAYQHLKSTSHVILGIIGAVTPWPDADDERWKEEFSSIVKEIDTFLAVIDGLAIAEDDVASQRKMLEIARSFAQDALDQGQITREVVSKAINDMRPIWAENMEKSARAELNALHSAVSDARAAMSDDEWAKMYVVHHGGSSVKDVNVVLLYLQRVMPEKVAAGQILFAENAHGNDALAGYAGYVRMQRHVGAWAFGDPERMRVDLLGYEAGAILDEMIPAPPPKPSD
ncbi:hypothetical protein [Ruegeria sp.]|uniref:hypothetical protein n=1 Tax=Ruegeria sp. TaxID=1879320 RepID=UPI003B5C0626